MREAILARRDVLRAAAGAGLTLAGPTLLRAGPTASGPTPTSSPTSGPVMKLEPGCVTGWVRYEGPVPEPAIIDCSADPQCAQLYRKGPLRTDDLLVSREGGLENVFVSVQRGLDQHRKWPVPPGPALLDQRGCRYLPHVFGVVAGQPLEIRNSSRINEVPHGYPARNPEFSFTLPKRGMSKTLVLLEPEVFKIGCDVHPWESAWCHVLSHPFFAVTDAEGRFVLPRLGPGEYELEFWHEHGSLAPQMRRVAVGPDAPVHIDDVTFEPGRQRGPRPPATRPAGAEASSAVSDLGEV